ncbi:hypothetical protein V5F62_25400, partial [Xanthobacter sp. VTT E-85237]
DPLNLVDIYGLAADSPMRSRSGYFYESFDALLQAPHDIRGYASDLMSDPLEFLWRAGPTVARLGMAVPLMRVGQAAEEAATVGEDALATDFRESKGRELGLRKINAFWGAPSQKSKYMRRYLCSEISTR